MASIRKRNNRWQVQIRRQSFPALTKTFLSKKNAQSWARKMENLLEEGLWKEEIFSHLLMVEFETPSCSAIL